MGFYSCFTMLMPKFNSYNEAVEQLKPYCDWATEHKGKDSDLELFFMGGGELPEAKWYDCDRDMAELSKAFPEVQFVILIEVEDGQKELVYAWHGEAKTRFSELVWNPEPWPFGVEL